VLSVDGRAVLFGYDPAPVRADVEPRPRGWRLSGAAWALGLSLLVAPIVAVLPPHAPWAIGALAAGAFFARRRWQETHTLMSVEGGCPRCGEAFSVKPSRLERPHPLECDGCHHTSALTLPEEALA
jgi:hypothetical protein